MNRLREMIQQLFLGMSRAGFRFPLTVFSLSAATGLLCYMISLHDSPPLFVEKLMFTFLVGAVLGMAAQFAAERFSMLLKYRFGVYAGSALLTVGYYLIIWPVPEISQEISVRTFVAVVALICAVLWFPSFQEKTDFNKIALIHFKSFFTSVLYSGVLSAGIAAIIAAVDILLFEVNSDAYSYMMAIIWVLFATIYYLSLLPKFNSDDPLDIEAGNRAENYPKFLEILVSFITIPLISAYTLVLFAYFIKILVTSHWPSGQLGPMVLVYSAVGLIIFILSSLLENRFAVLYRKIFPKVLIPIVIMQLISVGIRLNAYGITESRYYVALFGIFSIVIGVLFSIKPRIRNSIIALLVAGFAIFSIIPPIDAFSVSRVSQINRVEAILQAEGILTEGQLKAKTDAAEYTKIETTNILSYLDRSSSLKYIQWLPEDFQIYRDMKSTFGFEPTYPYNIEREANYFIASLDTQEPLIISDYDIYIMVYSDRFMKRGSSSPVNFTLAGVDYELSVERLSNQEARVAVRDKTGTELIGTGLYEFAKQLESTGSSARATKEAMSPEEMTFSVSQNGYKLKIIFQHVNIIKGTEAEAGVDYSAYVLFGAPAQ